MAAGRRDRARRPLHRGDPGGGSLTLGQLVEQHRRAVRADLQAVYGLDLADVWRGTLAPSRVLDLLAELPPGSRFTAAVLGDRAAVGWDQHAHLLADLIEAVQMTVWATVQVHSRKVLAPPARLPRPGIRGRAPARGRPRELDLSRHPDARPLPAKYRIAEG